MSRIVGYHSGTHDASIVIIDGGEIIIAVEEERFTRIKSGDNQPSFPFLCKDKIQEKIGFNILDADWICTARPISLKFIKESGLPDKGVKTFDHHECHAKAAYLTSGFEGKAITFTFDGGGDGTYGSIWLCEDGQMQLVKNLHIGECASLGQIWANSCHPYGWKPVKDEGKIMGMSGNGVYDENIYRIISSVIKYGGKGSLNFLPAGNNPLIWSMVRGLEKQGVFQSDEGRKNYAYALQKVTEEVMVEFVKDLISIFPEHSRQMCFGGGIFANVKMNQKINEIPSIEEIYVLPPMGDESISLGSAISMAYELGEWPAPKRIDSLFWGLEYSQDEIDMISDFHGLFSKPYKPEEVAELLDDGLIGAFFSGRFEFGPRALGARSIIVKATEQETHDVLNSRLGRHEIMPFAPAILKDKAGDVFHLAEKSSYSAEFMTICYTVKDEWVDRVPACIHNVDKTGRPQFVDRAKNSKWYELINAYYLRTGIPLILNTSFNGHGEPIIDTPDQAFAHISKGTIDFLIAGDKVYFKEWM